MKAIKLNIENYFAKHFPGNDNIQILGGTIKLTKDQLAEVAAKFDIKEFQVKEAEVLEATKKTFQFKYYHYTLSYGENSPFWENKVPFVHNNHL